MMSLEFEYIHAAGRAAGEYLDKCGSSAHPFIKSTVQLKHICTWKHGNPDWHKMMQSPV